MTPQPQEPEWYLVSKDELRKLMSWSTHKSPAVCQYERRLEILKQVQTRPTPSRNILDTDLCVCGLTEQQCQDKINKAAAQAREDTLLEVIPMLDARTTAYTKINLMLAKHRLDRSQHEAHQ